MIQEGSEGLLDVLTRFRGGRACVSSSDSDESSKAPRCLTRPR